jgi:hypothetical protein
LEAPIKKKLKTKENPLPVQKKKARARSELLDCKYHHEFYDLCLLINYYRWYIFIDQVSYN